MPVSHLTSSLPQLLAQMLSDLTSSTTYNALNTSVSELLARNANALSGGTYSHLTSSDSALLSVMFTELDALGYTFAPLTETLEEYLARAINGGFGGGAVLLKADFSSPNNEPWVFW